MILFKFFIENPVLSNSINPSLLDSVSSSGVYNTLCCLFSMKDCLLITSNVGSLFGDVSDENSFLRSEVLSFL